MDIVPKQWVLNQDVGHSISRLKGKNFWAVVLLPLSHEPFSSHGVTCIFRCSVSPHLLTPPPVIWCYLTCTGRHICCKWPHLWCLLIFLKLKFFTQLKNKWNFGCSCPPRQTEISLLFLRGKSKPVLLDVFSQSNPFDQVRQ